MSDPFDVLRSELVQAAARAELGSPERRWEWLRRRPRPLAVVIAALVICGSATAAVLSLSSSPSQPLSGRVPGAITRQRPGGPLSVTGEQYRIVVTPSLAPGQPGWTTGLDYTVSPSGSGGGGESAGGTYPTASNPVFGGASDGLSADPGRRGDTVAMVLTGPQVAAVRFGQRTIRTFTSPQLPTGDRAAVFFVPPGSPQPTVWSGPPNQSTKIPAGAVRPLDASGRVLSSNSNTPDTPFQSYWQAPAALTPQIHEPAYHGPTRPSRSGICQLAQHGLPGLVGVWGNTISRFAPAAGSLGELFESCVGAEYYLHGWPLAVGVLLDARHPGRVLGPL
ncbi:MAG: hypothetical protein ACRDPA_21090, partial [Solirubrobacteraceae bacterium]